MSSPEPKRLTAVELSRWSGRPGLIPLLAGLAVLGGGGFLYGAMGDSPLRAWQAYLLNLMYFLGISAGALLFSAIQTITHATWGRPIKRLAESLGSFLFMAPALLAVLFFGRVHLFPWIRHPLPAKAVWLNVPFLFLRDGCGLALLAAAALALLQCSLRREIRPGMAATPASSRAEGGEGTAAVAAATIYAILYVLVLSLLAFDLMMSLSPEWYSTLFGAYYFVASFFTGLAALIIVTALALRRPGMTGFIGALQLHNAGKLLLGFTLLTGDFFFTQFLVIWYGNLPEETEFVILRAKVAPWQSISWVVLIVSFIGPFLILLSRRIKMLPQAMMGLCAVILAGMWLEKFLLIAPSLWHEGGLPLGWIEFLVTLGFVGLFGMGVTLFLRRFPMLPYADPLWNPDADGRKPADGGGQ